MRNSEEVCRVAVQRSAVYCLQCYIVYCSVVYGTLRCGIGASYLTVLKPSAGEHGNGVSISWITVEVCDVAMHCEALRCAEFYCTVTRV